MNFFQFIKKFPTEQKIIDYFIKSRYKKLQCNHYGCNRDFSIFKGTIFEESDTDLHKWFYATHLFLMERRNICKTTRKRDRSYL